MINSLRIFAVRAMVFTFMFGVAPSGWCVPQETGIKSATVCTSEQSIPEADSQKKTVKKDTHNTPTIADCIVCFFGIAIMAVLFLLPSHEHTAAQKHDVKPKTVDSSNSLPDNQDNNRDRVDKKDISHIHNNI